MAISSRCIVSELGITGIPLIHSILLKKLSCLPKPEPRYLWILNFMKKTRGEEEEKEKMRDGERILYSEKTVVAYSPCKASTGGKGNQRVTQSRYKKLQKRNKKEIPFLRKRYSSRFRDTNPSHPIPSGGNIGIK